MKVLKLQKVNQSANSKQQMSDCIIGLLEEGLIRKTVLEHKETYYDSPLT